MRRRSSAGKSKNLNGFLAGDEALEGAADVMRDDMADETALVATDELARFRALPMLGMWRPCETRGWWGCVKWYGEY